MALAYIKVHHVMARRNFQGSGAEFLLDGLVANDGDVMAHDRQDGHLTHEIPVAGVFGMHCDAGVTQHGFGASGGYSEMGRRVVR